MTSPLQTATLQAAVLNITSSIIAQLLTAYRGSSFGTSSSALNPLGLDFVAILQYLTSTLLLTPPNFKWQEYLEGTFPGYPMQKGKQKMKVDDNGKVQKLGFDSIYRACRLMLETGCRCRTEA